MDGAERSVGRKRKLAKKSRVLEKTKNICKEGNSEGGDKQEEEKQDKRNHEYETEF